MKKLFFWLAGAILAIAAIYFYFIPAFEGKIPVKGFFSIGFLEIRFYGLIVACAVLAGYFFARKNSWKFGVSQQALDDFTFWAVIIGLIGARIYYVIFSLNVFLENPSEIYKFWHGGLSIYGGILAGIIFAYFYSRKKAFSFFQLFDLAALSLPLAQAIGRFGNFFNQEAFGSPTNLPWRMYISPQNRPSEFSNFEFFHPAFLYEALFDLVIFAVLLRVQKKLKMGYLGFAYLATYSLGRFFIEGIRVDSFFVSGFRGDQIVALILFLFSGSMILYKMGKSKGSESPKRD